MQGGRRFSSQPIVRFEPLRTEKPQKLKWSIPGNILPILSSKDRRPYREGIAKVIGTTRA